MKNIASVIAQVRDLIESQAGISGQVLTEAQLVALLQERMTQKKIIEPSLYLALLQTKKEEFQTFLERIVVSETWFFRHRASFDFLTSLLKQEKKTPYRILSAPCSSGEEPYSLAMALLDAGFSTTEFAIDALDVSETVLAKARQGEFKKRAFRSKESKYRDKYFQVFDNEIYKISDLVKKPVHFIHGNLFADATWEQLALHRYRVIYCRNCLMYFHPQAQATIVDRFSNLLESNGLLFVSPVEIPIAVRHGFTLQHPYKASALVK